MLSMVVATDFSQASAEALRGVVPYAQRLGARVVLVHAFTPLPRAPRLADAITTAGDVPFLRAETNLELDEAFELTERWAQPLRAAGLDVETVAQPGTPEDVVLEEARRRGADLIVIGRQGLGKVRRFIMGSTTKRIVDRSTCPVLVMPAAE